MILEALAHFRKYYIKIRFLASVGEAKKATERFFGKREELESHRLRRRWR